MECVGSGAVDVTERPERTARGHRRSRCDDCGRQFDERNAGLFNRAQHPSEGYRRVNVGWRLPRTRVWPLPCAEAGGGVPSPGDESGDESFVIAAPPESG